MAQNPHLARLDALEKDTDAYRTEIDQLQEKVLDLEAQLAMHMAPVALEADTMPIWTERAAIDSTVKDGFRVKECTVTVQNAGGDEQTREERRRRIAEAIEDGQAVADAMNSQRDQVKRFA